MLLEMRELEKKEVTGLLSSASTPSSAACPVCREKMGTISLQAVPVEHCNTHGLWFDKAELETVLYRTARNESDHPRSISTGLGTNFWLLVSGLLS